MTIPLIDISGFDSPDSAARSKVVAEWARSFETLGFATIAGHGVPEDLLTDIHTQGKAFFDLPLAEKRQCSFPGEQRSQGYVPMGIESVARTFGQETPADLCQSLSFASIDRDRGARGGDDHRANLWPDGMDGFRLLVEQYQAMLYKLAQKFMRISALALDLPEGFFAPYFDRMPSHLRFAEYPDQKIGPLPGQLRYGAHQDYTGFTILRQDDAPGGLQVRGPRQEWIDVMPVPGTFVVNAGNLLAQWTNDRWMSNVHRVINPPRNFTGSTRRLSVVFFTGPNDDAEISCLPSCQRPGNLPKYPPVKARDHLMANLRASMPDGLD